MLPFIAVCLGLLTLLHLALAVALVVTLLQVRRAALAAEALAYRAQDQLSRVERAADGLGRLGGWLGSPWAKAAAAGAGIAASLWARRRAQGREGCASER